LLIEEDSRLALQRVKNMFRHYLLGLTLLLAAAGAIACTTDPAVKKQQYFESGNSYFDKGELPAAIIEYRNAVDIDATFGAARKRLAEAYAKAGDGGRALEEYVRAADLLPQDADVQVTAGAYLLGARRAEDAVARADAALKLQPENIQAQLLRGNALAGLSSFDEALEAIEGAIKLDPSRASSYTNLGVVEMRRGRADQAEDAFKRAVALAPKTVETHLALGNYYWAAGRAKEAEQSFQTALTIDQNNAAANRILAALMIATNRRAEAEAYLVRVANSSKDPSGTFALADYYVLVGRSKDAVARLEVLKKDLPGIPQIDLRLARARATAGDTAGALTLVEAMIRTNANDAEALLLKGQLLLNDEKRAEAFDAVKAASTANPSSAEAQFTLGRMYASRGDTASAEAAFREVLRLNPRATAAQLELSRLQLSTGNTASSLRSAEEAAKAQPRSIAARLTLVRSLLASKDFGRAERELSDLRRAFPNLAVVHAQAGTLALLKNDLAGAKAAFDKAHSIDPRSMDVLAGLLALDLKSKDASGARARIEKRLQEGQTPELLLLAAQTYSTLNDAASSEKMLRAAIEADPALLQPYAMLGQLYMSQRKLDQARAEFDAMASRQSKPVGALTMSGIIYQSQGNTAMAKKKFQDALAIDSRAVIAANNLAWIHAESGEDLDTALQLAQTATASAPDMPELMDTLGWVHYKRKQPQLAIPIFKRCVEKAPNNAGYHYHLGLAYTATGDQALARGAFQKALANGPDGATATEIRRLLASNAGPATR
jgi:tetratricopeptide (TPR) repeat protein